MHCCANLEQDFKVSQLILSKKYQGFVIFKGEIVELHSLILKWVYEGPDDSNPIVRVEQNHQVMMQCLKHLLDTISSPPSLLSIQGYQGRRPQKIKDV